MGYYCRPPDSSKRNVKIPVAPRGNSDGAPRREERSGGFEQPAPDNSGDNAHSWDVPSTMRVASKNTPDSSKRNVRIPVAPRGNNDGTPRRGEPTGDRDENPARDTGSDDAYSWDVPSGQLLFSSKLCEKIMLGEEMPAEVVNSYVSLEMMN